jgi:hypothetical protein
MTFGSPEDTRAFMKRCRRWHKTLRKEAKVKGERLFVEKPRPFAGRLQAYWSTAAIGADKPVAPPQQTDNVVAFDDARTERVGQS